MSGNSIAFAFTSRGAWLNTVAKMAAALPFNEGCLLKVMVLVSAHYDGR